MLSITKITTNIFLCIALAACANLDNQEENGSTSSHWDFDHKVQFKQTKLANHYYQLEVIPNGKVGFSRLATFMLRKSYRLCGGYHYQLEILQGIEGFDDKRAMPNYISPSLMAKVECQPKLKK